MKYIAYYRVSTKKQGLGLDAQKSIVENFVKANGGEIVGEYSEKESGKDKGNLYRNRVQLVSALDACKQQGAALIVAKVDRLTRDMETAANLVKHYDIVFCDHPEMDALQQGVFFGMAMQEREYISQRTKQALQAKREKGAKLGAPNATFTDEQRAAALDTRRNNARRNENNLRAYGFIKNVRGVNWGTLANLLNQYGFKTAKGGNWQAIQVQRLAKLFEE